jgi:LPXTG-site transpeptidase (sortase) family protein
MGSGNQDTGTGTNGEDFTTSQDEGTGSENGTSSQDDGIRSDGTILSQDEEAGNEECIVADTVPNESLLPTGAPRVVLGPTRRRRRRRSLTAMGSKSLIWRRRRRRPPTAKRRRNLTVLIKQKNATNGGTQKKTSSGTQKKTTGGEAKSESNRSETQNTSGSGGKTQVKSSGSEAKSKFSSGGTVAVRGREVEVDDRTGKEPRQEELKARTRFAAASDLAPRLAATQWARPSREEVSSTGKPRTFAPDPSAGMTLSARALGLYDMPVKSPDRREDLDNGLVHVPETSSPWDQGSQKNVFIAGHYLGSPQTLSRQAFYNLHKLKSGDALVLEDGRGQTYKYRVSEKFAVEPGDSWAMGEVRGRNMVTLQTCLPPDFGKRLMVRADRVWD